MGPKHWLFLVNIPQLVEKSMLKVDLAETIRFDLVYKLLSTYVVELIGN